MRSMWLGSIPVPRVFQRDQSQSDSQIRDFIVKISCAISDRTHRIDGIMIRLRNTCCSCTRSAIMCGSAWNNSFCSDTW